MQKSFLSHNPVSYLASSLLQHLYDNMPVKDDQDDTSIGDYRANPAEMKIPMPVVLLCFWWIVYCWIQIRKKQRRWGDGGLLQPKHACWWLWPRAFSNSSFKPLLYMLYDTVAPFFFHQAILLSCAQNTKKAIIKKKATLPLTSIYC